MLESVTTAENMTKAIIMDMKHEIRTDVADRAFRVLSALYKTVRVLYCIKTCFEMHSSTSGSLIKELDDDIDECEPVLDVFVCCCSETVEDEADRFWLVLFLLIIIPWTSIYLSFKYRGKARTKSLKHWSLAKLVPHAIICDLYMKLREESMSHIDSAAK